MRNNAKKQAEIRIVCGFQPVFIFVLFPINCTIFHHLQLIRNHSKSFWRDERHVGSNPIFSAICEVFVAIKTSLFS